MTAVQTCADWIIAEPYLILDEVVSVKITLRLMVLGILGLIVLPVSAWAQKAVAYSYVANTSPPDAFLALRSYPSEQGPRIMAMANGTKLDVLRRRADGWWYVKVWPAGEEGWAFSGKGAKAYILCCSTGEGAVSEAPPTDIRVDDFSCQQLWFGRNSIFKEAGYCFKTGRAISAFGNAGCQHDDINAVRLSADNQAFVSAIQRVEAIKGCAP
jgi:hypothetical protein